MVSRFQVSSSEIAAMQLICVPTCVKYSSSECGPVHDFISLVPSLIIVEIWYLVFIRLKFWNAGFYLFIRMFMLGDVKMPALFSFFWHPVELSKFFGELNA